MTQYRVYFIAGETLVLNESIYNNFLDALKDYDGYTQEIRSFLNENDKRIIVNRGNITHVLPEEIDEAGSKVVTPPTPQELKSQEEQNIANQDVTLDAQLSGLGGK